MIPVVTAEVQRATGRRIVRNVLLLGLLIASLAGVFAFVRTGTLDQAAYEQRVVEARARQSRFDAEVRRCVEERGGRSEANFRACAPDGPPPNAKDPRFHRNRLKGILQGTTGVAALVAWLVGASLVGAEFASRGLVTTLTFEPGRVRLFTAKSLAAVVTASVVALVLLLLMLAAMLPAALWHGAPAAGEAGNAELAGVVARGTALAAIAAAIGFALACVGRNTATALGVGFGYIIVVENILGSSVEDWRRWLLLGNTIVFVSGGSSDAGVPGRSVTGAAIFLAAVAVALLIGALSMFSRRERRVTPAVPEPVRSAYRSWRWTPTSQWADQATWRVDRPDHRTRYVKAVVVGHHPTVPDEAARLGWAAKFLPVPALVETGTDGAVDWLVTFEMAGRPAIGDDVQATDDHRSVVTALATGLRRFHDSAPADRCPFDFRVSTAIDHVRRRIGAGVIDPVEDLHDEHRHLDLAQALGELERLRPRTEDLVVCHGDYCPPNILLGAGEAVGFVDVGELGVADRWWDLAVATWSVTWNYGPGHEERFLAAYGAAPDPERQAFYRLLYDLAS